MHAALVIVALTGFLFAAQYLARHTASWLLWLVFGVVPVALTASWIATNSADVFLWIKLYSVLFCMCFGTAVRDTVLGKREWARGFITVLLALNILEAIAVDCLGGSIPHALNAVAGLALVVALPRHLDAVRVVAIPHGRDLQYHATPFGWIIGYSVWNWTFVYLNYPEIAGHHTAVLLSCVIVGMIDPRLWLQARACTLGLHLMAMFTFPDLVHSVLDTTNWSDPTLELGAAVAALCVAEFGVRRRLKPSTTPLATA